MLLPAGVFSTPSPANVVAPSHHRTQKALNLKLAGLPCETARFIGNFNKKSDLKTYEK
jgi:hypothetical protein